MTANERRCLTKFRLSNHKLMIEYGPYQNMPQEERLCKLCDSNEVEDEYQVEDEYHFAMSC